MPSHDSKSNIQQMEQGEKDLGIISSINSIHKKIINNALVSEFDIFSVPVKLNFRGNEIYQTCFGGFLHLLLIGGCLALTYAVMFGNGLELGTQITMTKIPVDEGDTGQTFFDHTNEPISFRGLQKIGQNYTVANISQYADINVYWMDSDSNDSVQLTVSTDCAQGYEFCIQNTPENMGLKVYGNAYSTLEDNFYKYLVMEILWCDTSNSSCPYPDYFLEISYSQLYPQKGGSMIEYKKRTIAQLSIPASYMFNISRQVFTSNNKFFGHLSNIFPFSKQSYSVSTPPIKYILDSSEMITTANYSSAISYVRIQITPNGVTRYSNQNFDDISDTILFFLSVKETFYLFIFYVFVQQYNKNAGLLQIADSLFYIDDPKTKKKYDFKGGFQVFLACMLHNHFLYKVLDFFTIKCGKSLKQYLPNKSICAISLMKKAETMLQENVFYGNLNELNQMENEASKKSPLIAPSESQENSEEEQNEISYFPFLPKDTEQVRKQKEIKREAFEQFCEANQFVSAERKNHVYKILTSSKLKHMLVHDMQKQFKTFLRNVRIQYSNDIYREAEDQEFSEIKVAVHDTTRNQMTAQNFIKK